MQVSSAGGTMPQIHPEGRELDYVALDGKLTAVALETSPDGVSLVPPIAQSSTALFDAQVGRAARYSSNSRYEVARDGNRFLMVRLVEEAPPPVTVILNWKPPA